MGSPAAVDVWRIFERPTNANGPRNTSPSRVARKLHHGLDRAGREIGHDQSPAARLEQPDATLKNARRMGHRQPPEHDLASGHVNQTAAVGLAGPPTVLRVTLAQTGHEPRTAILHRQTVQMTPVFGCECRHETRLPARNEIVELAQGAQARKKGIDDPEPIAGPVDLVRANLAGDVASPGEVAGVIKPSRRDSRRDIGCAHQEPHLGKGADHDPVGCDRQAHWLLERVIREHEPAVTDPADGQFSGLIRRDEQRRPQLAQDRYEARALVMSDRPRRAWLYRARRVDIGSGL